MDQLACLNVAALPLQMLLRAHPAWVSSPVVVVADDRPQAAVLFVNARARRSGILSGQRYATALALSRHLRAGTVSKLEIENEVEKLADLLRRYSPHVEPSSGMPGVFWLDVHGMEQLHPSLRVWADAMRAELQGIGMQSTVAVGFTRFGVYALAVSTHAAEKIATVVCADAAEEHAQVQRVPLSHLNLDPDVRDRLLKLGISTVGDFLRLPGEGIRARFGPETEALHQLAAGDRWAPLVPVPAKEVHQNFVNFNAPESNVERLLFVIKRLLDGLIAPVARQAQAVIGVALRMKLDDRATRLENVRPAAPTLDVSQLLGLIYLRLGALQLSAGVITLHVTADTCPATPDQQRLFLEQNRRNLESANQALARIRAECGERSVVRAHLCDAHLPAARFLWQPLERVPEQMAPRIVASRPLVRRIYAQPAPLSSNSEIAAAVMLLSASASTPETRPLSQQQIGAGICGPYVISGGWWVGGESGPRKGTRDGVHRDYYFVPTSSGELWWLFYDRHKRRFFLQGRVE